MAISGFDYTMGVTPDLCNKAPYWLDFILPNVYFHVTTAYAILRHNGVKIGKKDFLGKIE